MRAGLLGSAASAFHDAQEFSTLSELFKTLEEAQTGPSDLVTPRPCGRHCPEVHARLKEVQQLRHALGELN